MTRSSRLPNALVGSTGFVGSTLLRQAPFDCHYHSTDIDDIRGREFDVLVCAGAPAQKWRANRDPEADRRSLDRLTAALDTVTCRRCILISTVDVFASPCGVDERSDADDARVHPYGRHRRQLERWAAATFSDCLIVRLPAVVGPGLRKNIVYDLEQATGIDAVDSRSRFQFYPMVNLWTDLGIAQRAALTLLHLTAEPVTVAEVAEAGFARPFTQHLDGPIAEYDMRTRHAALFGGTGDYQYSRRESLLAIRAYHQSAGLTAPPGSEASR